MIAWLAAKQDPSLPTPERQQTLKYLVSFGTIPRDILDDLLPRLVHQAQNEGDDATLELIVDTLLALYRHNTPLDQDLWTELRDCRRAFLNGDDNQKVLGQKLRREMRAITKEAGQTEEDGPEGDAETEVAGASER